MQTEKLENPLFEEVIGNAQIFYFRNQLVVNDLDASRRFSLRLSDADDNLKIDEEGSVITGFGLARTTANLDVETSNAVLRDGRQQSLQSAAGKPGTSQPVETLGCICENDLLPESGCSSGGLGSTSCGGNYNIGPSGNISNCLVTCGSGTYACCALSK